MENSSINDTKRTISINRGNEDFFKQRIDYSKIKKEDIAVFYNHLILYMKEEESQKTFLERISLNKSQLQNYKKNIVAPRRGNVYKIALSLQLNLEETEKLLNKAGYSFDFSNTYEIIILESIDKAEKNLNILFNKLVEEEMSCREVLKEIKLYLTKVTLQYTDKNAY